MFEEVRGFVSGFVLIAELIIIDLTVVAGGAQSKDTLVGNKPPRICLMFIE